MENSISIQERKQAQRAALLTQMFAMLIGSVVAGEYMMLYANDVLGLSPARIAAIVGIAPFASILRIPALPYIQRIGLVRSLQLARAGQGLIVLVLLCLPTSWVGFSVLATIVIVFVFFRELGLGSVWQPLMRNITTEEDRGIFFARMRGSFTLVNLALSAAIAIFVGRQLEVLHYKILLGLAFLGAVNSIFWSRRIPEPAIDPDQASLGFLKSIPKLFLLLRKSKLFRLPLVITLIITASQIPIGIIYFREVLHVPAFLLGAQIFCATLGQVLSIILWGRVSDTMGFRPMLAGLLWLTTGLSLVLWIVPVFPLQEWSWELLWREQPIGVGALLLFGFGNGVLNAGVGIATTSVLHYHVKSRDSLITMNLFALIQLIFQSCLVFSMGYFLQKIVIPGTGSFDFGGWLHFDGFKFYRSGVVPFLMLLSIPLVLKLPNLKPWFNVSDFFLMIRHNPMRSLLGSRKVYDESEDDRIELARNLGDSRNPLNLPPLTELLQDPSYEVKVEAIRSLARTNSPFAGQKLQEIVEDEERRSLWDHAAWALGELLYHEAVPVLVQRLSQENPVRVRAMAARALGKIGDPEVIPAILKTLEEEDKHLHVVAGCCWALLKLDFHDQAETVFLILLKLRQREERYEMLSILCRWMSISDHWLLVSDSRTTAGQSLTEFIEEMSPRWRKERKVVIDAFRERDFRRIHVLLKERILKCPGHDTLIQTGLSNVLENVSEWTLLSVLATAWLLLGPKDESLKVQSS